MSFVAECEQCGILERGDFEDVGDAAEDHEQFHDVKINRVATDGGLDGACPKCGSDDYDREDDVVRCPDCGFATGHITDGGEDTTTWRLECMDCDFTDDVDVHGADETPPRKVERQVTTHKNRHDESHVVRVHRLPDQRDVDPSLLTDGGVTDEGHLDYCDECVAETLHYRDETDGMWTCSSCGRWSA